MSLSDFPDPGVYHIHNAEKTEQYVGIDLNNEPGERLSADPLHTHSNEQWTLVYASDEDRANGICTISMAVGQHFPLGVNIIEQDATILTVDMDQPQSWTLKKNEAGHYRITASARSSPEFTTFGTCTTTNGPIVHAGLYPWLNGKSRQHWSFKLGVTTGIAGGEQKSDSLNQLRE
ncbi:hypothetical protein DFH29DRAFT_873220 [Suillus ampliporus]|nr:hypothetical protein DFH29DRAFT_873220 [Suillus ampliporus]